MEKFDLHFECENGRHDLQECRELPTMDKLTDTFEALAEFGLGKVKRIIIDNIK